MESYSKSDLLRFFRVFELNIKAFAKLVFNSISGTDREETLDFLFNQKSTLFPAAHLLRDQHISQTDSQVRDSMCYLSDTEITQAVTNQLALYQSLTPLEFRSLYRPYDVLYAWKDFDPSNDQRALLFQRAFDTDIEFIETLSSLKYIDPSSQNRAPYIPENYLKHFFDVVSLKKRLESLATGSKDYVDEAKELLKLWRASSDD